MTRSRFENFLTSWKFFLLLVLLQFILMPVATKGFKFEAAGDLIFYTLGRAFIMDMYSYAVYFQIVMILALVAVIIWKEKVSRCFTGLAGCFYLLYAVIQNMAVTEQYGFSMVTVNVVMMSFVAFVWLRAAWMGNNIFSFDNITRKTAWTIPVAFFCLWWPMNMSTALPDFRLHYLWDSGSVLGFCPMTPLFLTLLILSKQSASRVVLRVTAMVGVIIGCYNMGNFATDAGLYLGLYHLPLLGMSIFALLSSKRKKNESVCLKN